MLACALILTACDGDGGASGPAPAQAAPQALVAPAIVAQPPPAPACTPIVPVKIQLYGDSTNAGYDGWTGGASVAAFTPASVLQADMDARFGQGTVLVEVRAVAGTKPHQLIDGTDGLNRPWPQSVNADIVVDNHGINAARDGVPLETYAVSTVT